VDSVEDLVNQKQMCERSLVPTTRMVVTHPFTQELFVTEHSLLRDCCAVLCAGACAAVQLLCCAGACAAVCAGVCAGACAAVCAGVELLCCVQVRACVQARVQLCSYVSVSACALVQLCAQRRSAVLHQVDART
jgi:hypothetical protein